MKCKGAAKVLSTASSPVLRWWGVALSNLAMLAVLEGDGGEQAEHQREAIAQSVLGAVGEMPDRPWDEKDRSLAGCEAWRSRLAGIRAATKEQLRCWVEELREAHNRIRAVVLNQSRDSYLQLVEDLLANDHLRGL